MLLPLGVENLSADEAMWWGWVAGIIDGEGSIGIRKTKRKSQRGSRWISDSLVLRVQMTDKPTLERLKQVTHVGSIHALSPTVLNGKPFYSWITGSRDAAYVLKRCLPVLVTKGERAAVALEYHDIVRLSPPRAPGRPVPPGLIRKREELRLHMLQLNKKGHHDALVTI